MVAEVSYFGIRHHGPGSARRLVEALDALAPSAVLIEGPADATALLPMLASFGMVLPVALVTYAEDDPAHASFFPFAQYSPEYQAVCWAVRRQAALRFIDLPAADRLARTDEHEGDDVSKTLDSIWRDPIGSLAAAAGYDDGESWWRDVIEENPSANPIFVAVTDAMIALRAATDTLPPEEAAREAHMRLEIARAAKEHTGAIAVVCGAWHVPALQASRPLTADRELLKNRPKAKIKATWAPWTEPRLAFSSGYGAGVVAPGWCQHVWDNHGAKDQASAWLARVAEVMRDKGHFVSTASVIEAVRLGTALAALRQRPSAGFEELRDAAIACLCYGERAVWDQISATLLIGSRVGAIPENTPLAPLLEDLQRQQRLAKLKPEALERELAVDLRTDSGLARSTLLHRLLILDVPWGRLADAGRSRGTFRENWVLRWESEFAVRLVEHLVYGATIADAAAARLLIAIHQEPNLAALAELVQQALVARLPDAADQGIAILEQKAALTSDCASLLAALAPMASVLRYGEARTGAAQHLAQLMPRLVVQAALALPYATRNLDAQTSGDMRQQILAADSAIRLAELDEAVIDAWHHGLHQAQDDGLTTPLIAGLAARVLYAADLLSAEQAATHLAQMLSPGNPVVAAAGFFDGFFDGMGERLINDAPLRIAVDRWLVSLEESDFVAHLPLFRRVFSVLDRAERRRLLDALFGRAKSRQTNYRLVSATEDFWPLQYERVSTLLKAGAPQ